MCPGLSCQPKDFRSCLPSYLSAASRQAAIHPPVPFHQSFSFSYSFSFSKQSENRRENENE
jgi:hypothetical protein